MYKKKWFVIASLKIETCWEWTKKVKVWYAASDHLYACITNEISSCKIKINNVEFIWNSTSDTEKKCKYLNGEIQNNIKCWNDEVKIEWICLNVNRDKVCKTKEWYFKNFSESKCNKEWWEMVNAWKFENVYLSIANTCNNSTYVWIKLDDNYSCRFAEEWNYTLMNASLTECYHASYYYDRVEWPNIGWLIKAIKWKYRIWEMYDNKFICTKSWFLKKEDLVCKSWQIKINDFCIDNTKKVCKTEEWFFEIYTSVIVEELTKDNWETYTKRYWKKYNEQLTKDKCEKNGWKVVLASKYEKNNKITNSCNDDEMVWIPAKLWKNFKCRNSDWWNTQTLMNGEQTICYTLRWADLSKVKPYNIWDKYSSFICTQEWFIKLGNDANKICEEWYKKVIVKDRSAFGSSKSACMPNNFVTCKIYWIESVVDWTESTRKYCEDRWWKLLTPNETKNCNDNNINWIKLDENLICRTPTNWWEYTIMNKEWTKCKQASWDSWYRIWETFNVWIWDEKLYFKCTVNGILKNEEDIFLDESIEPEDITEFYTNYICDEKGLFWNPLSKDFQCRAPMWTVSYTLMTDPGLSCFNILSDDLRSLWDKNKLTDRQKEESLKKLETLDKNISLYENWIKNFEKQTQLEGKTDKQKAAIKVSWSLKLQKFKINKIKEVKKSWIITREILQWKNAISINPLWENNIWWWNFWVCTTAGLFWEWWDSLNETISVKKWDTKATDNFLQYVGDDFCGWEFVLEREMSWTIINKMEIKASCETENQRHFYQDILKECKEWWGSSIYDWHMVFKKNKRPSCDVELWEDATDEEKDTAAESKLNCKDKQDKDIKEWEEEIEICLAEWEELEEWEEEKKWYSQESIRKKKCYTNSSYPFWQKHLEYTAICEIEYWSFNGDLVKVEEEVE